MSFLSNKKGRWTCAVAFFGLVVVMQPHQATAFGVVVTDPPTEIETTATTLETTIEEVQMVYMDLSTQSNWIDEHMSKIKKELDDRLESLKQKTKDIGIAHFHQDVAHQTAIGTHNATSLSEAIQADTSRSCALAVNRSTANAMAGLNQNLIRANMAAYFGPLSQQNNPSQETKTLPAVYAFCSLITSANATHGGYTISGYTFADATAKAKSCPGNSK